MDLLVKETLIRSFLKNSRGVAGIEFALTFPMYVMLIFGTIELGWVNFQQSTLNAAVQDVSREIYVQAQREKGISRDAIEKKICSRAPVFVNCAQNILAELIISDDFSTVNMASVRCKAGENNFISNPRFDRGMPNRVGFLRVCVNTRLFTPYGAKILGMTKTEGKLSLVTANAFLLR